MNFRKQEVILVTMLSAILGISAGILLAFMGIIDFSLRGHTNSWIYYVTVMEFVVPLLLISVFLVDFRACYTLDSAYLKSLQDSSFIIYLLLATVALSLFPSILSPLPSGPPLPEETRLVGIMLLYIICYGLYSLSRSVFINEFGLVEIENRRQGKRSHLKRDEVRKMSRDGDIISLEQVLGNDRNFRNRELAAVGLGDNGAMSSIDVLKHGLEDEEKVVRLACAIALCKLDDESGKSVLESFYQEGRINEQIAVVQAVQRLNYEWAVAIVSNACQNRKSAIREAIE